MKDSEALFLACIGGLLLYLLCKYGILTIPEEIKRLENLLKKEEEKKPSSIPIQ